MFKIFTGQNETRKRVDSLDDKIKKQKLKQAKSDAIKKDVVASLFLIVFLVIGYNVFMYALSSIVDKNKCENICEVSKNGEIEKNKINRLKESSGNKLYVIEYNTPFTLQTAEVFADKIDYLIGRVHKGDMVMLHIESPGGSSISCKHSYDQVLRLKKRTHVKVVAQTDFISASCGYMLSSSADYIVAANSALVGNVGTVFHIESGMMETVKKKIGGKKFIIGSSRKKEILGGDTVKSQEDVDFLRSKAIREFNEFKSSILAVRGDRVKQHDVSFSGDIFNAKEAIKLGLIDMIVDNRTFVYDHYRMGYNIVEVKSAKKTSFLNYLISLFSKFENIL